ncbi:MAG: pyrroline-5-carboxylate reductase [Planctomycetota bacterium]|nr:pyrroline-5-carboxylate reductase [Planctomycetota bacterium]
MTATTGHPSPPDIDLAVIGVGSMGGAVLEAALAAGTRDPSRTAICDPDPDRVAFFTNLGCRPTDLERIRDCPRLLLCVKPQIFLEISSSLETTSTPRTAISVMAGLHSSTISPRLGPTTSIVRAMPNTPASIGAGITALAAGAGATPEEVAYARRIFESVGTVVDVDESQMHAVTAVSGSGPAWVFRTAEAWMEAALREGLDPEVARSLVVETIHGAARLLRESDLGAVALREAVTSKGGTTAAGLDAMDRAGFDEAFMAAIQAAANRGRELDANGQ